MALFNSYNTVMSIMSSKNRLIFAVLVISLLLLFVKPALGVSEDFNAYASKKTVNVCACSLAENPLTVENTGGITSTYQLTQQGLGADSFWIDITIKPDN
jgi:hypothetical protein